MDGKKEVEEKQAIKVLQHAAGVHFRPVHLGNQMIIHPEPPWNDWAKNKDKMGGKLICEFTPWPKDETEKKEETGDKKGGEGGEEKKGEDKEKVKEGIKTDEMKPPPEGKPKPEEKEKDPKTDEVKK